MRCTKSQEEGVRGYFDVGVFGYGSESFGPALEGSLKGRPLVSITEVAEHPLRLEERVRMMNTGDGESVEVKIRVPVWFNLDALGKTPMCEALRHTKEIVEPWMKAHPTSFPPLVFNITDGEATDGDPRIPAAELRNLTTDDGNLLLFNVHLSAATDQSVLYPVQNDNLPDDFAKQLFEMSSVLPEPVRSTFVDEGYEVQPEARAFVFNAGIVDVMQCLDIGTRLKIRR